VFGRLREDDDLRFTAGKPAIRSVRSEYFRLHGDLLRADSLG
jgi:hypothetical protein